MEERLRDALEGILLAASLLRVRDPYEDPGGSILPGSEWS
jgi:hypothetical protein